MSGGFLETLYRTLLRGSIENRAKETFVTDLEKDDDVASLSRNLDQRRSDDIWKQRKLNMLYCATFISLFYVLLSWVVRFIFIDLI